jgi:PIN domain nuclease of toxin-antitoxin system
VRLQLDSHTLIWSVDEPVRLSIVAAAALQDPANQLFLSAATIWEIAIKVGQGKLRLRLPFRQWMTQAIAALGLTVLPITVDYADVQAGLPDHHRDPFDRLIIAQALTESMSVVGSDAAFDAYGVTRVW